MVMNTVLSFGIELFIVEGRVNRGKNAHGVITLDRIGIPNFPVFTGIKLIPIPPVYVFAKNRYTGTVFYTGIVLC